MVACAINWDGMKRKCVKLAIIKIHTVGNLMMGVGMHLIAFSLHVVHDKRYSPDSRNEPSFSNSSINSWRNFLRKERERRKLITISIGNAIFPQSSFPSPSSPSSTSIRWKFESIYKFIYIIIREFKGEIESRKGRIVSQDTR